MFTMKLKCYDCIVYQVDDMNLEIINREYLISNQDKLLLIVM